MENYRLETLDDYLIDFPRWLSWSTRHGVVTEDIAKVLEAWADRHPELSSRALEEAKELRLQLFRLLSAHALEEPQPKDGLSFLNRHMAEALSHLQLTPEDSGISLAFDHETSPQRLVWPIVYSAASLLTDAQFARLRRCGGDKCTWLFIDESKNRSRRWCDMKVCGNRAKSRAHYRRSQSSASR